MFDFKTDKILKEKYKGKDILVGSGKVKVQFTVSKVQNGWIFVEEAPEFRFRPYEVRIKE